MKVAKQDETLRKDRSLFDVKVKVAGFAVDDEVKGCGDWFSEKSSGRREMQEILLSWLTRGWI